MNKGEVRREASVPAQSRIDIRTLAQLTQYWFDTGVHVKSISQLISWSLESMVEILRINGKTGEKPTIEKAEEFMSTLGLMQRGMKRKKLLIAKTSESLSIEGSSLQSYAPKEYKAIHNNKNWTQDGAEKVISESIISNAKQYGSYSRKDILAIKAQHETQMKLDEKDEIAKELADVMANADVTVCEKTGRKIITPRGVPRGVVTEKDMEEINMEKEEREAKAREEVKEKREQEKLKKKREKLLAELDELDDEIVEKEDDTPIERTYDEIVEDRMNKEKVQLDKLSIANDPMFCDKTKVSDNG